MTRRRSFFPKRVLPAVLVVAAALARTSWGQVQIQGRALLPAQLGAASGVPGELAENVFMPAERTVLQQLERAKRLLDQNRYGEAVRYLGAILDGPEDYFFQPDKDVPVHRSLKAEAQRLIGQMPRAGRELYELQYGARAQQMLAEAVSSGDLARLAEVSRRFFHTQAGYRATLLLGLDHLDRGRPLAGALALRRLQEAAPQVEQFEPTLSLALATCWLESGMPERARAVLLALRDERDGRPVSIAGRQVPLFEEESQAVDWLAGLIGPQSAVGPAEQENWTMFRGDPSRNASTAASAPLLNLQWRIPATDSPLIEEILHREQQTCLENAVLVLPALEPLAVDDVVLMRTSRNLLAVDFSTGKRLWEVPVDDGLEMDALMANVEGFGGRSLQVAIALGYRMWDDATYGTISSDGQCVFAVEDLGTVIGNSPTQRVMVNGRLQTVNRRPHNRLAARDIHTGKLKWHLGGPAKGDWDYPAASGQEERFALRQAESFFLGPPLTLFGQLYVLAEVKEEIRLLALDAQSGDLLWSQQLAMAEQNVLMDPLRRLAGASPSYCNGILVCPTCNGAVVAVDLATRSLLWGYRYPSPRTPNRYSGFVFRAGPYWNSQPAQRWADATAVLAEGRVLVTPVDSDSLHCLNLIDGKPLWTYKREDDLYVACVYQDKVVLVGRRGVHAISLSQTVEETQVVEAIKPNEDGTGGTIVRENVKVTVPRPEWDDRTVEFPEGSIPSGRGLLGGGKYYVPLSSAEVLAIDLAAGKAAGLSRSRQPLVPGNLVCYKGKILSQGVDALDVFYALDAAGKEAERRLAVEPEDPAALALRGEILLDEDKVPDAVECLRHAYRLEASPRVRGLLRDALLEGLETGFAEHRQWAPEIEQLLDDPQQRARYLRLMATGWQRLGRWREGFECYLKLVDLDQQHRGLESLSGSFSVRRDRWLQARLAELRREAGMDEVEGAAIDMAIEVRLQAAIEALGMAPLRAFLDYFGNHPAANEARDELFRRLRRADQLLGAEMLLLGGRQSLEPARLAELAELLGQAKCPQDAALCYRRLGGEFADVVCLDGKTGRELLEGLPDDGPVKRALRREAEWPTGKVKVKTTSPQRPPSYSSTRYAIPYRGDPGQFLGDKTISFDQQRCAILGYDGFGRELWNGSLVEKGSRQRPYFNPGLTCARVCGHLLLLSVGQEIIAVDTLDRDEAGGPKLLWSHDLSDPAFEAVNLRRLPLQVPNFAWGMPAAQVSRRRSGAGVLGPATNDYVAFQRYRNLVVVDPLSGDVLWTRRGTTPGSVLFGDEELLFAVAPDADEAMVFRALDGELLGKRKVPRLKQIDVQPDSAARSVLAPFEQSYVATLGRRILTWQREGGQQVLRSLDVWQQRESWPPRKFAPEATVAMAGDEAVGVLQPDGHFLLLALPDGRTIAEVELHSEPSLSGIVLFRSGRQYVLVTHSPGTHSPGDRRSTQQIAGTLSKPISHGRVYSFDLDGNLLWPEPVEIEDQHVILNQPGGLPVLAFACQTYDGARRGSARYQVSILCLDRRTGRKVYSAKLPSITGKFELLGDPEQKTITLTMNQQSVTMTFTDEPVPAEGEQEPQGPRPQLFETVGAMLKALHRAAASEAVRSSR